jgi:iron complex outermembrane recepter protein
MKKEARMILLSSAMLAVSMLCVTQPAWAQAKAVAAQSSYSNSTLQEIVVTANKREESLNRVGLSVTAISGQVLAERKIGDLSNIAAVIPGLTFAQSSSNTPILTMRGVGFDSPQFGAYPAVSAYVDQFPLPFSVLASHTAYDLERIEALKGPQGTLFGQNSTGGAINFIAAKPTHSVEAGGDISYGRFNDVQGNAYLSGPLSNTLRARIAGTFENSDGWQISNSRSYDRNGKKSYGAGRLILDWDASDSIRFSLNVNGWIDKSEPQTPQFVGLHPQFPAFVQAKELAAEFSPLKPRATDWSTGEWAPRSDRKFYQIGLRSDIDLTENVTFTSLTSYDDFRQKQTQDYDGLPIITIGLHEDGYITSFNQEIRLANTPTMPFRWIIGGNYESSKTLDHQIDNFVDNSSSNPTQGFITTSFQYVQQDIRSVAGFGSFEYDLTPELTAKAGIRYTNSRNAGGLCTGDGGDGLVSDLFDFLQVINGFIPPHHAIPLVDCIAFDLQGRPLFTPSHLALKENNVSWRVSLDYKVSAGTLLYANISRGYKAGSYPLVPASDLRQYNPVKQESVTSYEAGLKMDLFDRRAHLNVAAFYYDFRDKQVVGQVNLGPPFGYLPALVNVPKSRIYGLESDLTVRPVHGLTLGGAATYLNTRVQRYTNAFDQFGVGPRDLSGNKLPYAPKFSYTFDAEYRWELTNGGTPFAGTSVAGRSSQDTTIGGSTIVVPADRPATQFVPGLVHPLKTAPYATLDLRLGYEAANGAWRVMAFGKNVLNKYYWNNVTAGLGDSVERYSGMPATYGVTVGFKLR